MPACPNCKTRLEDSIEVIRATENYRCKNCGKKLKLPPKKSAPKGKEIPPKKLEPETGFGLGSHFEDLDLDQLDQTDVIGTNRPVRNTQSKPKPKSKPKSSSKAVPPKEPSTQNSKPVTKPPVAQSSYPSSDQTEGKSRSAIPIPPPLEFPVREGEPNKDTASENTENEVIREKQEIEALSAFFSSEDADNKEETKQGSHEVSDDDLFQTNDAHVSITQDMNHLSVEEGLPSIVLGDPGVGEATVNFHDNGQSDSIDVWGIGFLAKQKRSEGSPRSGSQIKADLTAEIKPFQCPICDSPLMAKTGIPNESVTCSICESLVPVPGSHAIAAGPKEKTVPDLLEDLPLEIPDAPTEYSLAENKKAIQEQKELSQKHDSLQTIDHSDELTLAEENHEVDLGTAFLHGAKELEVIEEPGQHDELTLAPLENEPEVPQLDPIFLNQPKKTAVQEAKEELAEPKEPATPLAQTQSAQEPAPRSSSTPALAPTTPAKEPKSTTDLSAALDAIPETIEPEEDPLELPELVDDLELPEPKKKEPQAVKFEQIDSLQSDKPPIRRPVDAQNPDTETKPEPKKPVRGSGKDLKPKQSVYERNMFSDWALMIKDPIFMASLVAQWFVLLIVQTFFGIQDDQFISGSYLGGTAVFLLLAAPSALLSIFIFSFHIYTLTHRTYGNSKDGLNFDFPEIKKTFFLVGVPVVICYFIIGGSLYMLFNAHVAVIAAGIASFLSAPFYMLSSLYTEKVFQFSFKDITLARKEDSNEWALLLMICGLLAFISVPCYMICSMLTNTSYGFVFLSVPAYAMYLTLSGLLVGIGLTRFLDVAQELTEMRQK